MNNRTIALLGFLVIILAVCALLLLKAHKVSTSSPQNVMAGTTTRDTSPTYVKVTSPANGPKALTHISGGSTYKSMLTQEGNYECDYDQVTADGQYHNVIYLSDGKLRAEFRSPTGNTPSSLSLYDGRYLYVWTEGTTHGVRTTITSLGQLPNAIPKDLTNGHIYGNAYNSVGWICHSWAVNSSLLTPPRYVTFY